MRESTAVDAAHRSGLRAEFRRVVCDGSAGGGHAAVGHQKRGRGTQLDMSYVAAPPRVAGSSSPSARVGIVCDAPRSALGAAEGDSDSDGP